ncbi:hypothetical protein ACTVZO_19830 [Streptomyces sp. IBSNAI002]|uniref:hypothetical protein n=1 Tax=Streptomyces sp. IBSNAI002 TaxID=3457500 RepID=UPI003FD03BCF
MIRSKERMIAVFQGQVSGSCTAASALASDEAGGDVEDAVAQGLGGGFGQVEGEELKSAAEVSGEGGGGEPGGVHIQLAGAQQADPGRLLVTDLRLDAGMFASTPRRYAKGEFSSQSV